METIVARCSSERLSVGVVPGPELLPGNTSGAEKSADNQETETRTDWMKSPLGTLPGKFPVSTHQDRPCGS